MKYEVIVVENHEFMRTDMFVVAKDANGKVFNIAEPVELVFSEYDRGATAKPTLSFDNYSTDLIKAFKEAFGKPEKAESVEAIKSHLEDMRTIAFHKLNIKNKKAKQ